jgi:hypothetical protein
MNRASPKAAVPCPARSTVHEPVTAEVKLGADPGGSASARRELAHEEARTRPAACRRCDAGQRSLVHPGSLVAGMGELLVARSLKVAAVVLGAVVLNRLVRWLLRRLVGGLEHRFVQNRLESLRAKTPCALLASTDPLPSLRRSQRAEMIGAAVANVASGADLAGRSHWGAAGARASARAPAGRGGHRRAGAQPERPADGAGLPVRHCHADGGPRRPRRCDRRRPRQGRGRAATA